MLYECHIHIHKPKVLSCSIPRCCSIHFCFVKCRHKYHKSFRYASTVGIQIQKWKIYFNVHWHWSVLETFSSFATNLYATKGFQFINFKQIGMYRIGCVSTRSGFLRALGYYAQHTSDFYLTLITRFGLLRAALCSRQDSK